MKSPTQTQMKAYLLPDSFQLELIQSHVSRLVEMAIASPDEWKGHVQSESGQAVSLLGAQVDLARAEIEKFRESTEKSPNALEILKGLNHAFTHNRLLRIISRVLNEASEVGETRIRLEPLKSEFSRNEKSIKDITARMIALQNPQAAKAAEASIKALESELDLIQHAWMVTSEESNESGALERALENLRREGKFKGDPTRKGWSERKAEIEGEIERHRSEIPDIGDDIMKAVMDLRDERGLIEAVNTRLKKKIDDLSEEENAAFLKLEQAIWQIGEDAPGIIEHHQAQMDLIALT